MKSLCYIQARAGSKRYPGKNRANWYGEPLYRVAYNTAVASGLFDEVVVYTDDDEILFNHQVRSIARSKSVDSIATDDDVVHELSPYLKFFDIACKLYPTTPLLTSTALVAAYQQWQRDGGTGIRAVAEYEHPPIRAMEFEENWLKWDYPRAAQANETMYPKAYYDCGAFQFFSVDSFMELGTLDMPGMNGFVLSWWEHQDINYPGDLDKARAKHEWRERWKSGH